MWDSEQYENFFGVIVLQPMGHPARGYEIWFGSDCAPPTISLQLLLCLWMGVSFSDEFQHSSVDGCSTASCNIAALAEDEHTSFYFITLNWKTQQFSSLLRSTQSL